VNVWLNWHGAASLPWALLPLGLYSFGWALLVPVVTLMVLDLFPHRRGMASSLQATVGSVANAWVAGGLAPMVMHDARALAWGSAGLMGVGWLAWRRARLSEARVDGAATPSGSS
jgi:MFS transporter, DHA1 family, multidrug resistance protein